MGQTDKKQKPGGGFSSTTGPETICTVCHNCRPLYEECVAETHEVLAMPGVTVNTGGKSMVAQPAKYFLKYFTDKGYNFPPDLENKINILLAKKDRIKRITSCYAKAFFEIDRLGVQIPFPGAATFAANVVHHEVDFIIRLYIAFRMDETYGPGKIGLALNKVFGSSGEGFHEKAIYDLIKWVIYGNLVVFVEVFPIYTFCIKHFKKYGVPKGRDIENFSKCLKDFIIWWDTHNFGSGDETYIIKNEKTGKDEQRIRIDRDFLFHKAIIFGLKGQRLDSAINIMINEQKFTLQEYMYDKIDAKLFDFMKGSLDIDDGFYLGTIPKRSLFWLKDYLGPLGPAVSKVALIFAYDLNQENINEKYIIPWTGGNVTDFDDRVIFTDDGIKKFIKFYYETDHSYMKSQLSLFLGG